MPAGDRASGANFSAGGRAALTPFQTPAEIGPPFHGGTQIATGSRWLAISSGQVGMAANVNGVASVTGVLHFGFSLAAEAVQGMATVSVGTADIAVQASGASIGQATVEGGLDTIPGGLPGPVAGEAKVTGTLGLNFLLQPPASILSKATVAAPKLGVQFGGAGTLRGRSTVGAIDSQVQMYRVRTQAISGNVAAGRIRMAIVTGSATRSTGIPAGIAPANAQDYEPITPLGSIFV